MALQLQGILGLIILPALAWMMSENRRAFDGKALLRLILGRWRFSL